MCTSTNTADLAHVYESALVQMIRMAEQAKERDEDSMREELTAMIAYGRGMLIHQAADHDVSVIGS